MIKSRLEDQDDVIAALTQMQYAAQQLKLVDPQLLDSVMLSTPATGPLDASRIIDAIGFDLAITQRRIEHYRNNKMIVEKTA